MKKYYIQLFSPHGLIRHNNPEIGRDRDTGGQVKYVLELMEALSKHDKVQKVDLFTRKIKDKRVSPDYEEEIETINEKARIVRIQCGGNTYRKKESLWNYLDEFIDKTIRFNKEQDDIPDIVHGHYADGNYIAFGLSKFFQIPYFSTGHSLGRSKKRTLLEQGMSPKKIEDQFNMEERIKAEEAALRHADVIITSTKYEIKSQYLGYESIDDANFVVIPPGVDTDLFYPFYRQNMPSFEMSVEQEQGLYRIITEIERFLFDPSKPLILSIGRPDKRKNFEALIRAYGLDKELQTMANLAIFAGFRRDITQMPEEEQEILTNLLLLMDKYDLYGKLAIPKKNDPKLEIPEIYRLAARRKGVFINAAPGENFGLTLVEAASCGLPVIASPTGGPKEIIEKCKNGILVNVADPKAISKAVKEIIGKSSDWDNYSTNGIKGITQHFSWKTHVSLYLNAIDETYRKTLHGPQDKDTINIGRRLSKAKLFLISDLDGTLIDEEGDENLDEFNKWLEKRRGEVVFGIATGRNEYLTRKALEKFDLPDPEILICSAGSELFYTKDFIPDSGWESYISYRWNRQKIQDLLQNFPRLEIQEQEAQMKYKLSYYADEQFDEDDMADLYKLLDDHKLKVNILFTDHTFMDILPYRAGKGNAIKYLSYKWKAPMEQFITAGNGGNDINMLRGKAKGIVVSNYSSELEPLRKSKEVYFAESPMAEGIMEGIQFYMEN